MALVALTTYFWSCGEDNPEPQGQTETENEVVSGLIEENTTWKSDKIYELAGRVIVTNGVTLTIQAGTLIKGRKGDGSLASALVISRGGKIMAMGEADSPVIFTSIDDNIKIGEIAGSNLVREDNELWGGLIILGKAPISAKNGDTEASIEGLPADEDYGLYGGDDANDNSGVLQYVSIRHGGTLIGEGNEINGLTLGGVGSGTTINHLEIYATLDDGIEFFGGTVNVSNVVIYWQGDDGLDIDQNYAGTIDNFIVIHGGNDTDEGTEIDGPENSTHTDGKFTEKNGMFKGDGGAFASEADIKDGAQGTFSNVIWTGYADAKAKLQIEGEYNASCVRPDDDAVAKLADGDISISGSKYNGLKVYAKAGDGVSCSVADDQANAEDAATASDSNATGPNMDEFGWTMVFQAGLLN